MTLLNGTTCAQACDFYMCTACAVGGSCRVLTLKHKHPLMQTFHEELWHCNVCRQEYLPTAAAVLATAATNLPTAKPAVVAQMPDSSAEAVAVAVAVAAAKAGPTLTSTPAYRCDVGCDFDVCEDCFTNPELQVSKGGKPHLAVAETARGRLQIGGISVLCWAAACCRLVPAMGRAPAAAAAAMVAMSTLLLLVLLTLRQLTSYDPSKHAPKAAGSATRPGDWFCERCQLWRTVGTYHCGTCGECTEGFDHHCGVLGRDVGVRNQCAFVVLLLLGSGGALVTLAILAADVTWLLAPGGEESVGWLVFDVVLCVYIGLHAVGYGVFAALQCHLAAAGLQMYRHEPCDACAPLGDDEPARQEGGCARLRVLVQEGAVMGGDRPGLALQGVGSV